MNDGITKITEAVVEETVYNAKGRSGFAVNKEGDGIFLHSRIVSKVGLCTGDVIQVHVVPNYPDKRKQIKYRAMRAKIIKKDMKERNPINLDYLSDDCATNIRKLLTEGEWSTLTLIDICEELAEEEQVVYDTLATMPDVRSTKAYYIV
jgi:hypothetical protein